MPRSSAPAGAALGKAPGTAPGAGPGPGRRQGLVLVACHPLLGHLPGWRQPALMAEFALGRREPDAGALARLDERLAAWCPPYAERAAPAFVAGHPLLQRVLRLHQALLAKARFPLFNEGAALAAGHDKAGRAHLRLALPAMGHDAAALQRLLADALHIVRHALDALTAPAELLDRAARLATHTAPRGFNSNGLLMAADQRRIPWVRLADNVVQFGWGARARLLDSTFTDHTPNIGTRLARDKLATAMVLRRAGLPVPQHAPVLEVEHAVEAARALGWPVVVKPQNSDGGRGVTVGIRDEATLREAFGRAQAESPAVLVERHVEGNDYRLQVFHGQVFWAVHRKPGGVTGDGQRSVAQLLAELNADPRRGLKGSGLVLKRIELNDEARRLLAEQGLHEQAVPEAGRFVRLRLAANVGNGGTPIPVLEQAHPDNLALGARAARLLRLDLAGIDLLMPDIARSWLDTGAAIIEVNAQPQVSPHLHAWLIERLVEGDGRVPVVGVVSADESRFEALADAARRAATRDAARLAAAGAAESGGPGPGLGIVTGRGSELAGQRLAGPASAVVAAQNLLADPACTALLLHLDPRGPASRLLPADRFDALVLAAPPAGQPGGLNADWMAHGAALAAASRAVWAEPAFGGWPEASAGWAQPATVAASDEDSTRRLLAALAGQHLGQ